MTDAYENARREQLRRSDVMRDAQRFGPPGNPSEGEGICTQTSHTWAPCGPGAPFLICEVCTATVPVPEAEPGVRLVALPDGWED